MNFMKRHIVICLIKKNQSFMRDPQRDSWEWMIAESRALDFTWNSIAGEKGVNL